MGTKAHGLDDEAVEAEIARLQASPHVRLAKKKERIRYRRRQYMYCLRQYEKRGKKLEEAGITMEILEALSEEADITVPDQD